MQKYNHKRTQTLTPTCMVDFPAAGLIDVIWSRGWGGHCRCVIDFKKAITGAGIHSAAPGCEYFKTSAAWWAAHGQSLQRPCEVESNIHHIHCRDRMKALKIHWAATKIHRQESKGCCCWKDVVFFGGVAKKAEEFYLHSFVPSRWAVKKQRWSNFNNLQSLNPSGFYKTSNSETPRVTLSTQQRGEMHCIMHRVSLKSEKIYSAKTQKTTMHNNKIDAQRTNDRSI